MKYIKTFEAFVDVLGNIEMPDYLMAGADDTMDDAYSKGREAYDEGCDKEENPYITLGHEDTQELSLIASSELEMAWNDGWEDASSGRL